MTLGQQASAGVATLVRPFVGDSRGALGASVPQAPCRRSTRPPQCGPRQPSSSAWELVPKQMLRPSPDPLNPTLGGGQQPAPTAPADPATRWSLEPALNSKAVPLSALLAPCVTLCDLVLPGGS